MTRVRGRLGVVAFSLAALFAPVAIGLSAQQRGAPPPSANAQSAPSQATGTAIVSGQIVDAASNAPIGNAVVTLAGRGAGAARGGRAGGPQPQPPGVPPAGPVRLLTGADGRFVLHDVPAGSLSITVNADGYVPGTTGQTRPNGPSEPVTLTEGQHLTDLKIRLWKYAVLSGTVVDEAGEPSIGLPVQAYRRAAAAGRARYDSVGRAKTDDRGVYRVASLPPGEYIVGITQSPSTMPASLADSMLQTIGKGSPAAAAITELMNSSGSMFVASTGVRIGDSLLQSSTGIAAPGSDGRVMIYQSIYFPGVASITQATAVTVKSGEERSGVDLSLKLAPTASVSGMVSGRTGPIGFTNVRLVTASTDMGAGDPGYEVANTTTGTDGTFTMLGVPPGQFIARVAKPPRPVIPPELASNPMVQLALGGMMGPPQAMYGEAAVSVGGSDISGLSIMLSDGARVTGRAVFDGTSPPPPQAQAQPITVQLQSTDRRAPATAFGGQQERVSPGEFKTAAYPPGKYLVVPSGFQNWIVRSVTAAGRDVTNDPIELADQDITDVVITYTDRIGQITGVVRPPAGAAITAGSTVFLFPANYHANIAVADARRFRNAMISTTGTYTFGALQAGEYFVAALATDDVPDNRDEALFEALSRVATRVVVAEGDKKSQDLQFVKVVR
jgi:hypothetical protein